MIYGIAKYVKKKTDDSGLKGRFFSLCDIGRLGKIEEVTKKILKYSAVADYLKEE